MDLAVKILMSIPTYGIVKGLAPILVFCTSTKPIIYFIAYDSLELKSLGCWPGAHVMLQVTDFAYMLSVLIFVVV